MTASLPDPLVCADVVLRDFLFMPLEVARLRRSRAWLLARRKPEIGFYMMNLWAASWHETPAASIEDDDDVLADLAMCDPGRWAKIRTEALRGWVKCSDGRLYHPVVAEKAIEAWRAKCAQRARTEAARRAKELKELERQNRSVTGAVTDTVTPVATIPVTPAVTALPLDPREGKGREGILKKDTDPDGSGADAPGLPLPDQNPPSPKDQFWAIVAAIDGGKGFRGIAGRWLSLHDGDFTRALPGVEECSGKDNPTTWLTACIQRRKDAPRPEGRSAAAEPMNPAEFTESRDYGRLKIWQDRGHWDENHYGPPPDHPRTWISKKLRDQFGIVTRQEDAA